MTLGEVLRTLSRRKRKGAYKIAAALGVYATTVYDWWKDEYAPNEENLRAYAALMEVTVEEILEQAQDGEQKAAIADRLYRILARIAHGEPPTEAFIAVTAAPAMITKKRRAALKETARQFKIFLSDLAEQDWDSAPLPVRERVLEQMRQELLSS